MDTAQPLLRQPSTALVSRAAPPRTGRPSWRTVALAGLVAIALHACVLGGMPALVSPASDTASTSLRVRALAPTPPPTPTPPPAPAPGEPAAPAAVVAPLPPPTLSSEPPAEPLVTPPVPLEAPLPVAEAASATPPEPVPPVAAASLPAPEEPVAPSVPVAAVPDSPASQPPAALASPWVSEAGEPLPVYATRFAPTQSLRYDLRRGLLSGSAVLDWARDEPAEAGAGYRLQLLARAAGLSVLTQESRGRFDAAGLLPLRFTDQRLRGPARAANFQPERGLIGFSGPSVEYPWTPGVQDRLSWMLQLPAIVAANPRLAVTGERIVLGVIGARGDAAVWVFRFEATEVVDTPLGEVSALKFVREPRKPNDTRAEVWLDPTRHHLPARARLSNPPDGEVFDLVRASP